MNNKISLKEFILILIKYILIAFAIFYVINLHIFSNEFVNLLFSSIVPFIFIDVAFDYFFRIGSFKK
jgi:hypothetical protein